MSARENIADILCIGCQKGSTSWLHSVLACHPDTHSFPDSEPLTSTDKEAHFWDRNHDRGESWYRNLMTPPDPALKTMDFTPEYAFLPDPMIAECKRLNPGARVIYILRDPMARAVSALRMHMLWRFGKGHEAPLQLGALFDNLLETARVDQHGAYLRNYGAWKRHYPEILLLNYEDLHADRTAGVARIMAHAGLDPARMSQAQRARFEGTLSKRVWESQPFQIAPEVLAFLEGFTRRTRVAVADALGMRFGEGPRLLEAAHAPAQAPAQTQAQAQAQPKAAPPAAPQPAPAQASSAQAAPAAAPLTVPSPLPYATLPPMRSFTDILVGPARDRDTPGVHWPDFTAQTEPRIWRWGRPDCRMPPPVTATPLHEDAPAVFVSMYDNHFGHMVAETVPRLPQSLAEYPDLPLIFTCGGKLGPNHPSGMFRAVLDWLDIPLSQVRFHHEPTVFRQLHVAAQAEHLDGPPAPPEYLHLLEARTRHKLEGITPEGITFVTRAGLSPQKGFHAAEGYLAECLKSLGVQVIAPEDMPLPKQMRLYAGARHLVFSEGSAIHGRQLIGRVDQHISILRRRFRSNIALHQMTPRAASLTYVPCFGGALKIKRAEGTVIQHAMSSLYNITPVLEHFEGLGVPLARVWDADTFARRRDHDVLAWFAAVYGPRIEPWLRPYNSDDYMIEQLVELKLEHLIAQARAVMAARK